MYKITICLDGDVATLAKWYDDVKKKFIVQCRQQRGTRVGPPPNYVFTNPIANIILYRLKG